MLEKASELLSSDTFAAIEYLNQRGNPKETVDTYGKSVNTLYWKKKDLPKAIITAIAGIQYAMLEAHAQQTVNPQLAAEFRGDAKAIAYDLASFTWTGWNEPDIVISQTDKRIGLEAARTNLRLAQELSRGDLPLCRAHWLLGAHYLACDTTDKAKQCFEQSAHHARRAQKKGEELLAIGYSTLSTLVADPNDEAAMCQWAEINAELKELENGHDFLGQLTTARQVFSEPTQQRHKP
jgi:hypothetical protein